MPISVHSILPKIVHAKLLITAEEKEYFLTRNEFRIVEDNVEANANPHKIFRYMRLELVESYDPNAVFYVINEIQLRGEIDVLY